MSNVMNPDGTHKLIAGYSHAAGLQERDQRIAELEAENERLKARAPITILQAKAAINLWESEYVGQNSARLWDWAVEQARNPFRETPKEGSSDE